MRAARDVERRMITLPQCRVTQLPCLTQGVQSTRVTVITMIDQHGKGGDYIQNPTMEDEVETFPFDPEAGEDFHYSANVSSWMSQPQRFD